MPIAVVAWLRHGRPMPEMRDAAHWRSKAEELRAVAAGMQDPTAKTTMQDIADSYDRMARHADANAAAAQVLDAMDRAFERVVGAPRSLLQEVMATIERLRSDLPSQSPLGLRLPLVASSRVVGR
jgi:hypothetical protein